MDEGVVLRSEADTRLQLQGHPSNHAAVYLKAPNCP